MKLSNGPPIFQNKRVRYARADELELYSYSSSATLPVKRRHQPMSRFYSYCSRIVVDEHRHSPQECATLTLNTTTCRTTDGHLTDVWWLPKFHGDFKLSPLFH